MGNMTMSLSLLLALLVALVSSISSGAQQIPSNATVYDILPLFGLPSGLLPASVQSYSFNPDDGRFVVVLPKPCYIQFDYLVYYDVKITGVLKYGSITELQGIEVQRFWVWFDVDEIRVDLPPSNSIYFKVGVINKRLDVDQFQKVRSCRGNGGCASAGNLKQQHLLDLEPLTSAAQVETLLTE
uniref:Uncharacterized protein n=1 Tax=Kalanchoe fedtschenkoi TaxID=63787 RepID=A0A7N0VKL1_KALFE